jgi:hypothetical protein
MQTLNGGRCTNQHQQFDKRSCCLLAQGTPELITSAPPHPPSCDGVRDREAGCTAHASLLQDSGSSVVKLVLHPPTTTTICPLTSMFQVAASCLQRRWSFVPAKNISSAIARRLAACRAGKHRQGQGSTVKSSSIEQ